MSAGSGRDPIKPSDGAVAQLALLIGSLTDYAIFLLDPDGHILTWNPGAQRTKGYEPAEIIGEHYSIFYPAEARERGRPEQILATARRDGRYEEQGWRVRKDGERFWAGVVITALRDADGHLLGFGKVTRDLTELRAAQEELELFAASAAHDLQEPLRTITGFSELLIDRHREALPADGQEFLDHIAAAGHRMQVLITDLLVYARSSRGDLLHEPVLLPAALDSVVAALHQALSERGVTVAADIPADAAVLADRAGVELLLQNLVSNAVKYADAQAPEVTVLARRDGPSWVVAVIDNGPGIPEAQRENIFEPFAQLRQGTAGGTGLGLSIARRIAERHQGRIGVDDEPSGGSRFWFALPAVG